jgi:O-antigen ligase
VALLALSPLVAQGVEDVVHSTQTDLASEGNTDSARYRAALLLIYLQEFDQLGPFGNVEVVGTRYQAAWSIDNSFLYMLITGGWIGGGLLLVLALLAFVRGYRALARSRGRERLVRAAIMAAFVGMSGCIANVWFTPEFSALYLVLVALVWNQSTPEWYSSPRRVRRIATLESRPAPLRPRELGLST